MRKSEAELAFACRRVDEELARADRALDLNAAAAHRMLAAAYARLASEIRQCDNILNTAAVTTPQAGAARAAGELGAAAGTRSPY